MPDRMLKPGDVVEVRPGPEILETLDKTGALDGVPFMPEMLQYVGRRFTVYKRAEKVCDPSGSRRMRDTVLLDDLRCDGAAHGGCQAECRFYWKEAWLRRVDTAAPAAAPPPVFIPLAEVARDTVRPLDLPSGLDANDIYRCQATEATTKTEQLRVRQPGQYVREIRGGNVTVSRFLRVGARALWGSVGHRVGFKAALPMKLAGKAAVKGEQLNLQPGEWVQVKSAEEIGLTLDETGRNRGMKFSPEMVPACGQVFQVKGRVNRIIDEPSGKMIRFKAECIILEGNVCNGDYSPGRWFCPRELYPYWREAWLRRVDPPVPSS
ncbi:hypothetical protein WEI85_28340 [Actinomycetes bacterium KLBMP 9797]